MIDHQDSLVSVVGQLALVWFCTLFSRETLSYVALILTILYTLLLLITLLRKEWFVKRNTPPTDL